MLKTLSVLFVVAWAGVATAKPVPHGAEPSAAMGYVGGAFTSMQPLHALAFIVTNQDSGQDYVLPSITHGKFAPGKDPVSETTLIELPPGTYRLTRWMIYVPFNGTNFLGKELGKAMPTGWFSESFAVKAGDVVFLGRFITETQMVGYTEISSQWRAQRLSAADARTMLLESYRSFSSANLVCRSCTFAIPAPR